MRLVERSSRASDQFGAASDSAYRVIVVDDRTMPRIAARAMISHATDMLWVGEAASGAEAIALVRKVRPAVVLLDVEMHPMDGAETAKRLLAEDSTLTIVAWTVSDQGDDLLRMVDAGCHGYVLKDVGPDELCRALRAAIRRESPVPRRMLPDVLKRAARTIPPQSELDTSLTNREIETLRFMVRGLPAKRMATEMGIARSSVETHVRNIYRKLRVSSRGEAISAALKHGLINLKEL